MIYTVLVSKEKGLYVFYQVDKNKQICDCSRIGNSLDLLRGRPVELEHPVSTMIQEFALTKELEDKGENTVSDVNSEGVILKYQATVW